MRISLYINLALVKTPISYPGGKSRAVKMLYEIASEVEFDTYVEPFLGGGSLALYITQMRPDVKVFVSDAFHPLVCFWETLRDNPEKLINHLLVLRSQVNTEEECRGLYLECHEILKHIEGTILEKAVAFYVANKMAYGGLMRGDDCFSIYNSKKKFSEYGINKLSKYPDIIRNWAIVEEDYSVVVENNLKNRTLVYLDPPYDIKHSTLYGSEANLHKNFNHDSFTDLCEAWRESLTKIVISYNQEMRDKFPKWHAETYELWYSMQTTTEYQKKQNSKAELVLTNYFTNR